MTIYVDEVVGIVRVYPTGKMTIDELKKIFWMMITHPNFRPGMSTLLDLGDASLTPLTTADLKEFGAFVQKFAAKRGEAKSAVVTHQDIDFGIARMYEMWNEKNSPVQLRVFRSVSEAEVWLLTGED